MPNTEQSIESTGGIPEIEMDMEVSGMTQAAVDKTLSIPDMAADAKATGDAIGKASDDIADVASDVADILQWTGQDIKLTSDPESKTIAEAVSQVISEPYPVGSIYMSTHSHAPLFSGTWVEIGVTATWTQLKNGKRDYVELDTGDTGGTVHFWLRTE